MSILQSSEELGDKLCDYCPLDSNERGVKAPPNVSCEGRHCKEAYARYTEEIKSSLLEEAYVLCETEDRSTEYILQYLQDVAEVSFEEALAYILRKEGETKNEMA